MLYSNYRFYLAKNAQLLNPEESREAIEKILAKTKELELIRVAVDLTSSNKSISLLSASKESHVIKTKVTQILKEQGLSVIDMMEVEVLQDIEKIEHHHPTHKSKNTPLHPIKKHQKKAKHDHSHGHGHHHGHHHENHWIKAALGLIWGIGLLVLSIGTFNIPLVAYYVITGLTSLMTLYLGHTVYQSAWQALKEKNGTPLLYTQLAL